MPHSHLSTYLNDHLAGATAALELLEHLQSWYAGTDVAQTAADLLRDISADVEVLEDVMKRLDVSQSIPRRIAGWIGEKVANLKLKLDDPGAKGLRLLESAEALSLGVEGKRLLWTSLSIVLANEEALRGVDFEDLQRRAVQQREQIESLRLIAAQATLSEATRP
jgi:hypothetical protein